MNCTSLSHKLSALGNAVDYTQQQQHGASSMGYMEQQHGAGTADYVQQQQQGAGNQPEILYQQKQ